MRFDPGREAKLLAAALTTLTRLPVPCGPLPADWLARSAKYFPLVGAVVGLLGGLVYLGASQLWPGTIAAFLSVGAVLLLTGALHEDGLADTADSLGGRARATKLAIMKDPRLGPFGALALMIVLGLKVALLARLPAWEALALLVAAGSVSRFWAVAVMSRMPYAGERDLAKLDHGIEGPRNAEVALALVVALLPLVLLDQGAALAGLVFSAVTAVLVAIPVCRAIGGYTGDVLGAVVATAEVAFLLGALARL